MRPLLALLALVLAASPSGAEGFAGSFETAPGESVRIELASGDVEILAHRGALLRVEARARGLGASAVEFVVSREDGEIVLRSRSEPWVGWLARGPRIHVRAWVPRHLHLRVETRGEVSSSDDAAWSSLPGTGAQRPAEVARNLP
jgi:hypothetical protein